MSGKIPDRWIPYKALGKVIDGTRIICFKVPLHKRVQRSSYVTVKDVWDINTLLTAIPKLGAVIDLTNTAKYYDPAELKAKGVLYKKILIPGRQLPPERTVNVFMDAVDEFLKINDDWLIGVHCTHGLNRTGYMVCRYMRDRIGIPAKDAIKSFEMARGYQIERANFIADLLGKTPPPPDLGTDTVVKPIANKYDIKRNSSPMKKIVNGEPKSRESDNKLSWCVPSPKKKKRERSISKSSTSSYEFDYKYDY